jgi:hypothetical protein
MIEKEHMLEVLRQAYSAVKNENVALLKELSNQTIHSVSIYQDPDSLAIAVTIYSLGKIFENENFRDSRKWNIFITRTLKCLDRACFFLQNDKLEYFRREIIRIRKSLNLFVHLKDYIQEVFRKSSINKASRVYEHGISRAETASLLGVTQWELATYASVPVITDLDLTITKPIRERLKFTEDLFDNFSE